MLFHLIYLEKSKFQHVLCPNSMQTVWFLEKRALMKLLKKKKKDVFFFKKYFFPPWPEWTTVLKAKDTRVQYQNKNSCSLSLFSQFIHRVSFQLFSLQEIHVNIINLNKYVSRSGVPIPKLLYKLILMRLRGFRSGVFCL